MFSFFLVSRSPNKQNPRVEVRRGKGAVLVIEKSNWSDLFRVIHQMFPGQPVYIPDEIPVVKS